METFAYARDFTPSMKKLAQIGKRKIPIKKPEKPLLFRLSHFH